MPTKPNLPCFDVISGGDNISGGSHIHTEAGNDLAEKQGANAQ